MFAFTNTDLSRAVLALRSRGVAVRVLVEEKNVSICGSQIPVLLGAGKRTTRHGTYLPPSSSYVIHKHKGDIFGRGNTPEKMSRKPL